MPRCEPSEILKGLPFRLIHLHVEDHAVAGKHLLQSRRIRGGIALFSCALTFPDPRDGAGRSYTALPPDAYPWNLFDRTLYRLR